MNDSLRSQIGWRKPASVIAVAVTLALVCMAGCNKQPDDLETEYGDRNEVGLAASVNGYSVLADMFAKAGHAVSHRSDTKNDLKAAADVIVYAPDDFGPPDKKSIAFFDGWLREKKNRTLIYIGRDFDAAPIYWRKIRPQVPPKLQATVDRRLAESIEQFQEDRRALPTGEAAKCEWFEIDAAAKHTDIRTLRGDWDLSDVDASKADIELNSRINSTPNVEADDLLTGNEQSLVFRQQMSSPRLSDFSFTPPSQLIVVANGSFLVNLQLVNKEHRKMAGKLIAEIKSPSRVVFLHANAGRSRRSGGGGQQETAGLFDVFGVWPLSVILIQWIIVLALVCFSRWPIFGPPRDPPPAPATDFSRHIAALAETWELTRDSSYAHERWQYYQEHVRGEAGAVSAKRRK